MRRTIPALTRAVLAGAAVVPLLNATATWGANSTWLNNTGDSDSNWSTPGNWSAGAPGNADLTVASSDTVTFGPIALSSLETPTLDTNRRIGVLQIDNSDADYSLNAAAGVTLGVGGNMTVSGGGMTTLNPVFNIMGTPVRFNTGSAAVTLASGLIFGGTRVLTLVNTTPLRVNGDVYFNNTAAGPGLLQLDGSGSMVIAGNVVNLTPTSHTGLDSVAAFTGKLTLTGNNAFGGNLTWRAGTLELGSANATGMVGAPNMSIGTATGSSPQGTIVITGAYTVGRALLVNATAKNSSLTIGGTNTSGTATYSGNFNLNTCTVAAFNLTASAGGTVDFSGVLSSSVSNMNKVGLGTVRFTSDTGNTYSGRTSVAAGTLLITNTSGSGTGTAVVQVGPAGTFGGSGISGSSITVSAGGKLRAGTGAAAGGSLTLGGDLTLNDGSVIQLVLGNGATHSTLARTGGTWAFDAGQGVDLLGIGVVTPGQTYDNVITNLAADPGVADWQILTPQWAGVFSFDGVNVDLTTTATPEPAALSLLALGATALLRRRRVRAS